MTMSANELKGDYCSRHLLLGLLVLVPVGFEFLLLPVIYLVFATVCDYIAALLLVEVQLLSTCTYLTLVYWIAKDFIDYGWV